MLERVKDENAAAVAAALRKEVEELREEVEALRAENDRLRSLRSNAKVSRKRRRRDASQTSVEVEVEDVKQIEQIEQQKQEKEEEEKRDLLPDELWEKILKDVDDNSVTAFASVSKQLRRVQQESGRKLKVNLKGYKDVDTLLSGDMRLEVSEGWCLWAASLSVLIREKRMRRIMNAAALHGHLSVLKHWKDPELIGQKIIFDEQTCAFAAYGGCLEVLIWLRENNCPWGEYTCSNAAREGHLDVLKYAHKKGCPWDKRTCSRAAEGGHLEVLKYAHENGCSWDEWTCYYAAEGGHLEVLKYARLHGCPFDKRTCMTLARKGQEDMKRKHNVGHQEVIEYLEKLN